MNAVAHAGLWSQDELSKKRSTELAFADLPSGGCITALFDVRILTGRLYSFQHEKFVRLRSLSRDFANFRYFEPSLNETPDEAYLAWLPCKLFGQGFPELAVRPACRIDRNKPATSGGFSYSISDKLNRYYKNSDYKMGAKKSGLGRGLDALLGGAPVDVVTEKDKLKPLPIEYLKAGRYQPRKDFDPVRLQELADSIGAQGIMQPILVRRVEANRYEILAGERRWRAAQLAGLHEVPAIIREVSDQAALAIALIENLQREDLNPLEEAEALRRLHQEFSLTHQQIADSVAKSRTTVTNLLRLNDLHADVKTLVRNSDIEMGHARAILGLPDAQQIEAAHRIVARGLNVREAEALVRHILEGKQQIKPEKKDPDVASLEKNLSQTLGAKVEIRHNKKGVGKLVISYDSLDQLEGVVGRFSE